MGAKYIIGSDIVEEQIVYMKKRFQELGIDKEKYELHTHDSKIVKQLSEQLADFALVLHLLCFADTKEELLSMSQCIYDNLKEGGTVLFYSCHPIDETKKNIY